MFPIELSQWITHLSASQNVFSFPSFSISFSSSFLFKQISNTPDSNTNFASKINFLISASLRYTHPPKGQLPDNLVPYPSFTMSHSGAQAAPHWAPKRNFPFSKNLTLNPKTLHHNFSFTPPGVRTTDLTTIILLFSFRISLDILPLLSTHRAALPVFSFFFFFFYSLFSVTFLLRPQSFFCPLFFSRPLHPFVEPILKTVRGFKNITSTPAARHFCLWPIQKPDQRDVPTLPTNTPTSSPPELTSLFIWFYDIYAVGFCFAFFLFFPCF